jgi:hypothetical protein
MTGRRRTRAGLAALAILIAMPASPGAHVGSPDVFVETSAGPYRAYVTVRPPAVIPGVADIEVLVASGGSSEVRIVPTPLAGDAARFAPTPDRADPAPDDPQRYTGRLWMMSAGAWQVRVTIDGALGSGTAVVPVPTLPQATRGMSVGLELLLASLMVMLAAGAVAIVSAMAREGSLGAGEAAGPGRRRRGRIAGAIAMGAVVVVISLGNWWWSAEAGAYARYVYRPLAATTSVDDGRLTMTLSDPGWIGTRVLDDLVEDHGRLMHLFVVSPSLDRLWHLHPTRRQPAVFDQALPAMPKGEYEFFADIVHATGLAETITGRFTLGEDLVGVPLTGDDSGWHGAPTSRSGPPARVSDIADGARIVWVSDAGRPIVPRELTRFTFRVEDAAGRVLNDLELYMGMPGHAVFFRRDRGVFAHVHPGGSAAMAAMVIGEQFIRTGAPHDAHGTPGGTARGPAADDSGVAGTITFPYGLPGPGDYRVFVQIRRGGRVETGVFDVAIDDAVSDPAGR